VLLSPELVKSLHSLLLRPLLATLLLALAAVTSSPAAFAQSDTGLSDTGLLTEAPAQAACPVGILHCLKATDIYKTCKRNDILGFFTPGLPPAGDRSKAQTTVEADKYTRTDTTHEQLEQNVRMQKLDALLKADFFKYDTETTDYVANGNVRYQDAGTLMSADHAHGTATPQVTYMDNVQYQMLDKRGNGVAKTVNQTDPDHSKMAVATYSTCDPTERQWEMRGNDIEVDHIKNEGYGHGVTMAFDGVPFFWFPYLSWPLDEQRQSGFLAPSIAYSDQRGLKVSIPYYFDLAPNYDMTLKPTEYTKRGELLGGEFRYLSSWDKLQLDFAWMPHDEVTDESRGYIRLQDVASFGPNWGASVDIHHVSDDEYLHDFGDSFLTTAVSLLQSSAYVNGHGDWWQATIGADTWEVTDPSLQSYCPGVATPPGKSADLRTCANPVVFKPYTRLPRIAFNASQFMDGFEFGVNSEYTNFTREYSIGAQRLDAYPFIAYPIETAGYFIRPELGYRVTAYQLEDTQYSPGFTKNDPVRSMPIVSIDSGLIFERDTNLFNTAFTQTLEPRLYYLYVPYRNQNDLPIFDTQLPSFDFPSLFRTNTYTGADRQVDANNLTAALTTRLINSETGDPLLSASIGQIRYLSPVKVTLPGTPDLNISGKDIIGEVDLRLNKNWDFTWDQQENPETHQTDLSSLGVQHRFGEEGVVNVSYRFRRGFLEQLDTTAFIPVTSRWSVIARYYYSLQDSRLLEALGGLQYDSCCVAARFLVRHYINDVQYAYNGVTSVISNAKPDNQVFLEIEFKGIGATGNRTENYLRSAILGHQ
jgi:LPS-assembly protein